MKTFQFSQRAESREGPWKSGSRFFDYSDKWFLSVPNVSYSQLNIV